MRRDVKSPPLLARVRLYFLQSVAGSVLGALPWILSQDLLGKAEPWDATNWSYHVILFIVGCTLGLVSPAFPIAGLAGVYCGQVGYLYATVAPEWPGSHWVAVAVFGLWQACLGATIAQWYAKCMSTEESTRSH